MAFDFPATPSVGQVFGNYIWDGEKWKLQGGQAIGAVRYDTPQILSAGQQAQARSNIAVPDLSALNYSGMQVNGAMEVDQVGGGEAAANNTYKADSWILRFVGTMVARLGRSSTVVGGGSFSRIPWYLYYYVTTAQASMGAGDVAYIMHHVEGYRFNRLRWGTANAQPLTIGFWSNHDIPGTYSVSIRNSAGDRAYVATYTHNTATVEQYNVLTIPGCVDGAWDTTNGAGCSIAFTVACGATATAPAANAWSNGNYIAAPGQVNGVAATDKFFRITGVLVLPGIEAPTAAQSPLIMRPYDQELVTCMRYYYKGDGDSAGSASVASIAGNPYCFKVTMRAAPTVTATFSVNAGNAGVAGFTGVTQNAFGYVNISSNWTLTALVTFATLRADARL